MNHRTPNHMPPATAIEVRDLCHRYGDVQALDGVSFAASERSIFGFLGPNGGGKTTLFHILATLLPIQSGAVRALGFDLRQDTLAYRRQIGVTFQSPSLDRRLTVSENLLHQGHLYGLSGNRLHSTAQEMLSRFGVADRAGDLVSTLSGGLKRRVELAKCLLHRPRLLLLDEPSTGLDPAGRRDLWDYLEELRSGDAVTIIVTTHLMEEAERCDRLVLLDKGRIVSDGSPSELRSTMPGESVTIVADRPDELRTRIAQDLNLSMQRVGESLRIQQPHAQRLFEELVRRYGPEFKSISLGKPTLEDVFLARTGHRLSEDAE